MAANDKAALKEAQDAAWALLQVNSNLVGGGGSRLFYLALEALESKLSLLDEETKAEATRYIVAVQRVIKVHTLLSWRPYVLGILLALGIPEWRVDKECNKLRLERQALDKAKEEASKEDGTQPLPKRRRTQAPQQLALPAPPSGSAQPSKPAAQPSRPAAQPSRPPALLALGNDGAPTPPRGIERFFARSVAPPPPPEPRRPDDEEPPPTQEVRLPGQQQQRDRGQHAAPKAAAEAAPSEEPRQPPQQSPQPPAARQGKKRGRWGREEQTPRQRQPRQQRQPPQPPQQPAGSASSSSASPAGGREDEGRAQGSADGEAASDQTGEGHAGWDPLGHYAALGINKDATPTEIHRAYRKRALRVHPDKGGSEEAFKTLVTAYQTLTDPDKRLQYDSRGASSAAGQPEADIPQPADEDGDDEGGRDPAELAARAAYAHLLQAKEDWWDIVLGGLSMAVLEHLAQMSTSSQDTVAVRRSSRGPEAAAEGEGDVREPGLCGTGPGIKKKRDGTFWIQVGWRSFKVTAYTKPRTLEQALTVHTALTAARATALLRLKAVKNDLDSLQVGKDRCDPIDDCAVLTHAELSAAMAEAPEITLAFSTDLNNPRLQSPWTTSLDLALHFRVLMRKLRPQFQGLSGASLKEAQEPVKTHMFAAAKSNNAARVALGRDLAARVQHEVGRRREVEEARPPPPAPAQQPPPPPQPPREPEMLALKEVAAAAEVERLKERLEKEEQGRMAALEDLRLTNEAWRSSSERAEEQRRREIEEVRRIADEREERHVRRLEDLERRNDEYRDKLVQKCDEAVQAHAQAEQARRCPVNVFRRAPFAPTAAAMEIESERAAQRECFDQRHRRGRVHVGGTALEPTGSYTLCPPRRPG